MVALSQKMPFSPLANYLPPPLLLLAVLAMIILRIPPFLLDLLLTFNIVMAVALLLQSVYIGRPLDFTAFPTLLLLATLFRLALNIASTRIVLLQGHTGSAAAGRVIESFGEVMIAGNNVVGLVVFMILIIVNFVVITKGCTRISEVTARFTLDAMPGKQMAIDADLNAGLVDQQEAKSRRQEIVLEADFYGSMDGASKFVRGDAVASLLILLINLVGGVAVGVMQHDLPVSLAFQTYSLLTMGDGLAAQVPALLLSTAAAITVTRVSGGRDIQLQVFKEVLANPKAILLAALLLIVIGAVPGMPHLAFIGTGCLVLCVFFVRFSGVGAAEKKKETGAASPAVPAPLGWQDLPRMDAVGLEIGYRLIPLVDGNNQAELTHKIRDSRRELSREYGFLFPAVHIRDNMRLDPEAYVLKIHGVERESFQLQVARLLAIGSGEDVPPLEGAAVTDPAFGLGSVWIEPEHKEAALRRGYTVVTPATVIATHAGRLMRQQAAHLFGYAEAQQWFEQLRQEAPRLCDELVPDKLSLGKLMSVCRCLLRDGVSLADSKTIVTNLVNQTIQPATSCHALAEQVRPALGYQILAPLVAPAQDSLPLLQAFTLSYELEKLLLQAVEQGKQLANMEADAFPLEPHLAARLQQGMRVLISQAQARDLSAVLLVTPVLRPLLARMARPERPMLHVVGITEVPDDYRIEIIGQLGGAQTEPDQQSAVQD